MKLIFFSFRASYRKMLFNNFIQNNIYGKYIVINLGGPIKHYIAKFFLFLGIGKGISCDGNPLISNISKGINFWSRNSVHLEEDKKNLIIIFLQLIIHILLIIKFFKFTQ